MTARRCSSVGAGVLANGAASLYPVQWCGQLPPPGPSTAPGYTGAVVKRGAARRRTQSHCRHGPHHAGPLRPRRAARPAARQPVGVVLVGGGRARRAGGRRGALRPHRHAQPHRGRHVRQPGQGGPMRQRRSERSGRWQGALLDGQADRRLHRWQGVPRRAQADRGRPQGLHHRSPAVTWHRGWNKQLE